MQTSRLMRRTLACLMDLRQQCTSRSNGLHMYQAKIDMRLRVAQVTRHRFDTGFACTTSGQVDVLARELEDVWMIYME